MSNLANPDLAGFGLANPNLANADVAAPFTLHSATFSRDTVGLRFIDNGTVMKETAAGIRRHEDRGGADDPLYLGTRSFTNLMGGSEDFDSWTESTSGVVTSDTSTLLGYVSADTLTDPSDAAFAYVVRTITVNAGHHFIGAFVNKGFSNAMELTHQGGAGLQLDDTGATAWRGGSAERVRKGVEDLGTCWLLWGVWDLAAGNQSFRVFPAINTTANGGTDASLTTSVEVGGVMVYEGVPSPLPYIRNSGNVNNAEAADVYTFDASDLPAWFLSGAFTGKVAPYWSTDELASGDQRYVWSVGSNSDGLRFRHDGTGVLLEYLRATAVVAASAYLTISSHHTVLDYTIDHTAGSLTVAGADAGNGTTSGTSGSWSAATTRAMGVVDRALELDGRMNTPVQA